jgi:hypothetical protein
LPPRTAATQPMAPGLGLARSVGRALPLICFKQAGCEPRYIWLEVTAVSGTICMPLGLLDEHWRLAVIKAASSG